MNLPERPGGARRFDARENIEEQELSASGDKNQPPKSVRNLSLQLDRSFVLNIVIKCS